MELYHERNDESSIRRKTTCIKICFVLFTDDFVKLSAGSCSVSVMGGQIHIEGTVKEEF